MSTAAARGLSRYAHQRPDPAHDVLPAPYAGFRRPDADLHQGQGSRCCDRRTQGQAAEKAANAVGLLTLVAGQDVEPAEDSDGCDGRRRIARGTVADRIVSTVDPDARHIHKNRTRHQDGFKGHASFEPETGLFTAVALTSGYGTASHEAAVACDPLDGEGGESTVLGDSAYGTGDLRMRLEADGHTLVIKPPPLRRAAPGGFTIDDFRIDAAVGTATCPAGHTVNLGQVRADGARTAQFKRVCTGCPLRERCTTSRTGRTLNIHPQHELLTAARVRAATDPVRQDEYRRWRPPVERAIAWLVAGGNRRVPHRGVIANNIWLHHRAAALNLRRLINLGLTRTSTTWHLTTATT
ncbi:transposase [Streptomyces jumonjinensis]|uniref:transposase n=1 Tax=Streptomyces jumonjinensis TaxID=1945 RepID=UPI00379B86EC